MSTNPQSYSANYGSGLEGSRLITGLHRFLADLEEAAAEFECANSAYGEFDFTVGLYLDLPGLGAPWPSVVYEWDGEVMSHRDDARGVLLDFGEGGPEDPEDTI